MPVTQTGFRSLSTQEFDIFQKSDLPTPNGADKIPLVSGAYNVKSLIDIGTSTFLYPEDGVVTFRGLDAFITGFTSTTTGSLFDSENKPIFELGMVEMFIACPNGTVFDISSPSFNLTGGIFIFESAFGDATDANFFCKNMGTINNMGTFDISRSAMRAADTGVNVTNVGNVLMSDSQYLDWNDAGAIMFSFGGTCRNIFIDGNHFSPGATESIFDFDSGGTYRNVNVDSNIHDDTLGGSVFAASSLDQNADNFLFGHNRNMPETQNIGNMFQRDNAIVTTLTVQGGAGDNLGFVQVANFSAGELARLTFASNTLTTPSESGKYKISYSVCILGTTNQTYECALEVDGNIEDSSLSCTTIPTGGNPDTIAGNTILDIGASKTIKLMVRNVSSTTNVTIVHASVSVIKINR